MVGGLLNPFAHTAEPFGLLPGLPLVLIPATILPFLEIWWFLGSELDIKSYCLLNPVISYKPVILTSWVTNSDPVFSKTKYFLVPYCGPPTNIYFPLSDNIIVSA